MVGWHGDGGELTGSALVLYRQFPGTRKYFAYLPEGPVADWADPEIDRWLAAIDGASAEGRCLRRTDRPVTGLPPLGHRPAQGGHRAPPEGRRRPGHRGGPARHRRRRTAPGTRLAPVRRGRRRRERRRRPAAPRLPGAARRTHPRRPVGGAQPGVAPQRPQGPEVRRPDGRRRCGRTARVPPAAADHRGARRLPPRPLPRLLPAAVRGAQRRRARPDAALPRRPRGRDPCRPHHDQRRAGGSGTRPARPPTTAARSAPATPSSGG